MYPPDIRPSEDDLPPRELSKLINGKTNLIAALFFYLLNNRFWMY